MTGQRRHDEPAPHPSTVSRPARAPRRVRFPIEVAEDESLIGIVSRSAREHVLGRVWPILHAAGIDTYTPGAVTVADPRLIARLAEVLRQEPATLGARHAVKGGMSTTFGDLVLPMGTIDLRIRRIAPRSLELSPHHRAHWMNRLLACCPVTGERLVDRCEACGAELGWYLAWGIDTCEHCLKTIEPALVPLLEGMALEGYRLVADLMSPIRGDRIRALALLPSALSSLAPGTIAMTAIQLAASLQRTPDATADMKAVRMLDPDRQVPIVCDAGRMLLGWPRTVREMLHESMESHGSDHGAFFKSWRRLKRMASEKLSGPERAEMVLAGIPDLADNIWNSFAAGMRTYNTSEAMKVLGIDNRRTKRLAEIPEVVLVSKPSRYRGNRQFIADSIDDLRERKDRSVNLATVGYDLRIPLYGVEQLAASKQLEFRGDQAMLTAYPRAMASRASFEELVSGLSANALDTAIPGDARRLSDCVRLLGGDLKPWSSIIGALLRGQIEYWSEGERFDTRTCFVMPDDLKAFLGVRFDECEHDFPFSAVLTKEEVAEVLTIDTPQLAASCEAMDLAFEKSGRRMQVEKDQVRSIARRIISNAEIGEHWNLSPKSVRHDARTSGVRRIAYGWDRAQMVAAGLVPDHMQPKGQS